VTHTRSRREMIVVGDADFLAQKSRGRIFLRMLRAIRRDGVVDELDEAALAELLGSEKSAPSPVPNSERQLTFDF
jgi:predicted NAD/FAD-dependent oxidoreductase